MATVEETGKKKVHYAIYIFIGCCFLSAFFFALTASIVGVFISYASAGVNANPGDWSFNSTIGSVVGIFTAPFLGRWLQGGHFKAMTVISLCFMCAKFFGLALATELWQVYILGFIAGLATTVLMTMTIPNLIGNWFTEDQRGRFLGIATAFTGIGTFVWAPTFALIINAMGYRAAYAICATMIFVFCAPWIFFVFKFKPEEKGLQPYGYDPSKPRATNNIELQRGTSARRALKTPAFWLVGGSLFILTLCMGFSSYQNYIATEALTPLGFDKPTVAVIAATMISTIAVANMLSKLVFGFLLDKCGQRISILIFCIILICAFLVYIFMHNSIIPLYIAAFLLGTHNCLVSVGLPLTVRSIFGNRDYAKIFSYICMGTALMGAIGNNIIGWIGTYSGSYFNCCWYGLGVAIVVTILAMFAVSQIGKVTWDLGPAEDAAAEA